MEIICDEKTIVSYLQELGQVELVKEFTKIERNDSEKLEFISQIKHLESIYPGGIKEYLKRAKVLLNNSKNQINPYAGYKPSIPEGVNIKIGDDIFYNYEHAGLEEIRDTIFILVAGGLGERLGYDGIKIAIPTELVTKRLFIEVYIDYIKAYEDRIIKCRHEDLPSDWFIPLIIMTSDDTHEKTIKLFTDNSNFGLKENQIEILKQEKVPALLDNDCNIALVPGKLLIDTKPHGHGDVHTLLYLNGVVEKWVQYGKKWAVFFQDTNPLVFNAIPSAIGVSLEKGFVVNTLAIARKPGEAIGAICKLTKINNENESITINVEYNQLESLLKEGFNPLGDVANESGTSAFPGNTNTLIFELKSYLKTLNLTKGLMPEFVNPKYSDDKTIFKSPTRLECMMQDYPKLLCDNEKVGFTVYDRWFVFSVCKNNLVEGVNNMVKKGLTADTAFSVEADIFNVNTILLKDVLGKLIIRKKENIILDDYTVNIMGQAVKFGPKIVIHPSFAVNLSELKQKILGTISISEDSTLIIQGNDTIINNLELDGFINISGRNVNDVEIKNEIRFIYLKLLGDEGENYEQIRGYKVKIKSK